jgi:hypothetical protein
MFGRVQGYDGKPIFMIKVSVYRDLELIDYSYTDNDGKYTIEVPEGQMISVLFDTHYSLNNAEDKHPSVVANLVCKNNVPLDRTLMGTQEAPTQIAAVDALCAYLFAAQLISTPLEKPSYAKNAASRLPQLRLANQFLRETQQNLLEYFREHARDTN